MLLTVNPDGSANGPILPDYGGFMSAREQQPQQVLDWFRAADHDAGESRATAVSLGGDDTEPYAFLVALFMPGVHPFGFRPISAGPQQWLFAPDGSWACHRVDEGVVEQFGARNLWDEVEDAHRLWRRLGRPERGQFGLTIGTDSVHTLWLGDPDIEKSWRLPAP